MNTAKEIKMTLPIPPSVNGLYSGRERRFKSKGYKEWIEDARASQIGTQHHTIHGDEWLEVFYTFYTPIFNKGNKKIKKWDAENFLKAASDFLGEWIPGFDDSKIRIGHYEKIHSERREVEIVIREISSKDS